MAGDVDASLATFERDWARVVSCRLRGQPRHVREAVVRDLLAHGLERMVSGLPADEPGRVVASEDLLQAEEQVVAASGEVDVARYTPLHQDVRRGWVDAVEHFCRQGWTELANPGRGFDVWWYWSEYLDPTRGTVNPLLHHLLVGRQAGFEPVPPVAPPKGPSTVPPGPLRRVCLFAGYDPDAVVDDVVVAYVRELSRFADVYYLFDGYLPPDVLAKVAPYTAGAWSVAHGRYDFGSYSMLARDLVGWQTIEQYDELVLANDSAYLLRGLDEVFHEMAGRPCDWWGLQASKHDFHPTDPDAAPLPLREAKRSMVGERVMVDVEHLHVSSYFLAFRGPVLGDEGFRRRLDSVVAQPAKNLVILKYEIGISRYLLCRGFEMDTFITDLYPFHPLYTKRYFDLLSQGFPLLKRHLLVENSGHVPGLRRWKDRVLSVLPEADVSAIERHLLRVAPDDKLQRSFALESGDRDSVERLRPRNRPEVLEEDRLAPKFDHWWAFLVDAADHTLSGSLRALFEEVRDDPSLKKVVLTRSRAVSVDGENVVVVPFESPQGTRLMARCRYVFVRESPGEETYGLFSPRRHRIVNLGGVPLRPFPDRRSGLRPQDSGSPYHAVVVSSRLQAMAASQAYAPLPATATWRTGAPRNDLLLKARADLPDDLRRQEDRLVAEVGDRHLVLLAPAHDRCDPERSYGFLDPETAHRLDEWCTRRDVVLGYHEDPRDRSRGISRRLVGDARIDLGRLGIDELVVADRVAAGLVTDLSTRAVDFAATGKHVVLVADPAADRAVFHDLDTTFPATVVRDPADLVPLLENVFEPPDPSIDPVVTMRRRLFFAHIDDLNAERLVRRVRRDALEEHQTAADDAAGNLVQSKAPSSRARGDEQPVGED